MHTKRSKKAQKLPTVAMLRPVVLRITQEYGASNVRIFGSFARGEQTQKSDLDLLIDPPPKMSLFDLVGLQLDLEDALKRKVDVILARSVKPALRDNIFKDARPL